MLVVNYFNARYDYKHILIIICIDIITSNNIEDMFITLFI
jgi:hypothetical protein